MKVYELRIYKCKPKHYGDFLKLTNQKISLRTAASKLVGYWCTEIGGVNEVVHIWEYDSMQHRQNVRASLGQNIEWQSKYISEVKHMWDQQDNSLLRLPHLITPESIQNNKSFYLLLKTPSPLPKLPEKPHDPLLVANGQCVSGEHVGDSYALYRHEDIDKLLHFQESLNKLDGVIANLKYQTKIMSSTMFSPLQ
jgi:hypothetical protein